MDTELLHNTTADLLGLCLFCTAKYEVLIICSCSTVESNFLFGRSNILGSKDFMRGKFMSAELQYYLVYFALQNEAIFAFPGYLFYLSRCLCACFCPLVASAFFLSSRGHYIRQMAAAAGSFVFALSFYPDVAKHICYVRVINYRNVTTDGADCLHRVRVFSDYMHAGVDKLVPKCFQCIGALLRHGMASRPRSNTQYVL